MLFIEESIIYVTNIIINIREQNHYLFRQRKIKHFSARHVTLSKNIMLFFFGFALKLQYICKNAFREKAIK